MRAPAVSPEVCAIAGTLALAASYPLGRALHAVSERRRAVLESLGAGASVAYVTLDLLVELTHGGGKPVHDTLPLGPAPEHSLFALVLVGLTLAYVLEALASRHSSRALFAVDVSWGWVYNALVGGALVLEAERGLRPLALYGAAMLAHLTTREAHAEASWPAIAHLVSARLAVAAAPIVGGLLWVALLPKAALYVSLSLVAGTTLVQIVRDELPRPVTSRVGAFLVGVGAYTVLIALRWKGGP